MEKEFGEKMSDRRLHLGDFIQEFVFPRLQAVPLEVDGLQLFLDTNTLGLVLSDATARQTEQNRTEQTLVSQQSGDGLVRFLLFVRFGGSFHPAAVS